MNIKKLKILLVFVTIPFLSYSQLEKFYGDENKLLKFEDALGYGIPQMFIDYYGHDFGEISLFKSETETYLTLDVKFDSSAFKTKIIYSDAQENEIIRIKNYNSDSTLKKESFIGYNELLGSVNFKTNFFYSGKKLRKMEKEDSVFTDPLAWTNFNSSELKFTGIRKTSLDFIELNDTLMEIKYQRNFNFDGADSVDVNFSENYQYTQYQTKSIDDNGIVKYCFFSSQDSLQNGDFYKCSFSRNDLDIKSYEIIIFDGTKCEITRNFNYSNGKLIQIVDECIVNDNDKKKEVSVYDIKFKKNIGKVTHQFTGSENYRMLYRFKRKSGVLKITNKKYKTNKTVEFSDRQPSRNTPKNKKLFADIPLFLVW